MSRLNNHSIFLFIVAIIFFFSPAIAQDNQFSFSHLTVKDGLSQSTVFSILQDHRGLMWFGTTDGLNKFDGYKFTVYNNNPSDSGSISGNSITTIYEDSENNLWIGTNEGLLNKYNRSTDTFTQYRIHIRTRGLAVLDRSYYEYPLVFSRYSNQTITCIEEDADSTLWIGTWGSGLIHFDKKSAQTIHYFNNAEDSLSISSNRITSITQDKQGSIWIATFGGGVNKIIPSANPDKAHEISFKRFTNDPNNSNSISDNRVFSIYNDSNNNIWVGTFSAGLNQIIKAAGKETSYTIKRYVHNPEIPGSISSNTITSIIEDRSGDLWIGSFGEGLNLYNPKTKSFIHFRNDPFDDNSLGDNDVLSLYSDNSGILWIGSHLGKGLSKLTKRSTKFSLIKKIPGNPNSLNDEVVWAIYEDADSILWIGTYRGGLNRYDRKNNSFSVFINNPNDSTSISDNHVRSIAKDRYGNFWIGTYSGGLNFFNEKLGKFKRIKFSNVHTSTNSLQIQSIYIDKNNTVWLGTFGNGINYFELDDFYNNKKLSLRLIKKDDDDPQSLSDNRVYKIYPHEDKDKLWIGTYGGGLNLYDKKTGKFQSYSYSSLNENSLSDSEILCIFQNSEGDLWIGTNGGGLNKFDKKNEIFERYGNNKGFKSQVIYGIVEDDNKNLWISSDNGICKYSLTNGNVIYYDLRDGLQSMEFSGGAYFKNKSGEIYFGGISGINYFTPTNIKSNENIPPVIISEFKIFNDVIRGEMNRIEVSYDQNFITIEYAALDYTDPANNQYAHYMEGLETQWNYTDAMLRKAFYTNLEPGSYIFHAKGSNSDGVWNNEGISLEVVILPPFWKTWWFILLSIILIGSLVSFLISMKVKHLLAMEKLKVRLAADLHDNVGAGLTEISILSELTSNEVKEISPTASHKLNTISETARHLVDSMSDIVWFVNPKRDSLHDIIIRLKDSYADLLSELGVSFRTNNIDNIKNIKIPMDIRQNLFLLFKEGINNSIKHSKCNRILLEAQVDGTELQMILNDNGIGIPYKPDYTGNGLRNMKERAYNLGGELQINSEEGKGTTIKFIGKLEKPSLFNFLWS